jgi:hypothetical protein
MVMPDDKNIAWTNTLGMAALLSVLYAAAYILSSFQPTLLEILVTCFALALVTLVAVNYYSRSVYENVSCRMWTNRAILGFTVALLGGVALQVRPYYVLVAVCCYEGFAGSAVDVTWLPLKDGGCELQLC